MISIQRILFPTDFTNRSERAFADAAQLAELFDAELHVLNVVVSSEASTEDPMRHLGLEKETNDTWSDAVKLAAADGSARIVHAQVRIASPSVGILHYADSHDIDLIVMSTHGRKGLDHFLLGSVAEEIVRLATCSVLTIRDSERRGTTSSWKRILVPVDFSDSSEMAVIYAKELAGLHEARLDFLHVIEEAVFPTIYGLDPVAIAVPEVIERSKNSLAEIGAGVEGPSVPFECHVTVGHPANEIVKFAEKNSSDLITFATHGLTGLQRLLIGSVTEKVLRLSERPVLTVKSQKQQFAQADPTGMAAVYPSEKREM